ncbi:MAG: hypothetical protein IJL77_00720 [Clostridia bacterium]|nr:hypothetical protein [Clostridia bacterium]
MKNNNRPIIICVTPQGSCVRIIEKGIEIAAKEGREALVLSVIGTRYKNDLAALDMIYSLVEKHSLGLEVYFNNEPAITAAVIAKRMKTDCFVTGLPDSSGGSFISLVRDLLPDLKITMIGEDGVGYNMIPVGADEIRSVKHNAF